MTMGESPFPRDWLAYAAEDFARVRRLLRAHDAGLAGFCLQQAIEKFLEAFLLTKGWSLRRIHALQRFAERLHRCVGARQRHCKPL